MSKADYMLSILWMLQQHKRTAAELAEALELSVRSVYRYIDALCASGVPVIADAGPGGGYRLPEHFSAAPLFFDDGERRALVQASAFAEGSGYPYIEALGSAIAKLKRYSNDEQLLQMQRHESGMEMLHAPPAPLSHLLEELEACAAAGLTVQLEYRKSSGHAASSRSIDPYGLVLWKGRWYLAGFCHLRREIRSFRVDRIVQLEQTGGVFIRPPGFSARQFLLDSLLPAQDQQAVLVRVVIASGEEVLNDLCSHWLFGHSLEQRIPGEASFLLDETMLYRYAPYFLLPYGRSLTVREPAALKQKLAAVAADISAYYAEP
ncbi:helix-turn-helix transcriptional regulator [Paenibacillus sp. FSL R7-0331]|uniref:helix-turn-helix transcriptional regulator n=1 Tax=Paenibacillus sp. FSL R7-0331 TaxID=1536773 RepID=UPI0004F853F0|nr:WYL domain-containing protein [Paenibacillus sp. FSL R7-0331]AIQ50968.1 DeoR faimly transcriptional regulator [Paenibacillus sp. FSL R7-0331]